MKNYILLNKVLIFHISRYGNMLLYVNKVLFFHISRYGNMLLYVVINGLKKI